MIKKIKREQAIEEIFEYVYKSITWDSIADMIRYGEVGLERQTNNELIDDYANYFEEDIIITE